MQVLSPTVVLPSSTDIGNVSGTEISYVDGVTSGIQTQINGKQATLVSGTNIKTINGSSILGSGDLSISGTGGYTTATKTANYTETATSGDINLLCDTTGGAVTIILPTAVGNTALITIKKKAGSSDLIIDGNGSETIDGSLTATLKVINQSVTLFSDNANWYIR